jgi:ABC-type Mn2+/Zn2+ transport system ATPase subunit
MNTLAINFKNCYGIKKLEHTFDFNKSKVHIIYAPNGAMKSSFAKTFEDIFLEKISEDRIFTERVNHRSALVDERDILKEEIFVINRMQDIDFKEASTILANETLKTEYDSINIKLNDTKKEFVKTIQPYFGLKENAIEQTIEQAFKTDIYTFIESRVTEINEIVTPLYTNISFNEIFNDKVSKFLKEKSFNTKIKEYIAIYDKLVNENTTFFKKGDFNHYNADNVTKSLKDNGFFKAQHKVKIKDVEIGNIDELEDVIKIEKERVLNDPELTTKFNEIDKALNANNELRNFRSYVEDNQEIIKEFIDLENFKKKLILNYIASHKSEFDVFVKLYSETKTRRNEITIEAKKEQTEWVKVLDIFTNRFTVPFNIKINNQDDVILKNEPASLIFTYKDGLSVKDLGGAEISKSLSTGEQRVFYLLNIIFKIETRKKIPSDQLFIIDDIADSFDYKNKYAIIEYLKDIADVPKFKMIILTHNFDFYKTIKSRFGGKTNYQGNWQTNKKESEITLEVGEKNDVFRELRKNFATCDKAFISCIPFVRNLIEYTVGKENQNYLALTSLLHIKPINEIDNIKDTKEHTTGEVLAIFNSVFCLTETLPDPTKKVYDLVISIADTIMQTNEAVLDLKSKLCLSIAIRYKAEDFIIKKVTNATFHTNIWSMETGKIIGQYKIEFPNDKKAIEFFERVNLMTAENLHLNSFMYEPLMDLSEDHLRALYNDVSSLEHNQIRPA